MSLPALMEQEYDGARLRLGAEVYRSSTQRPISRSRETTRLLKDAGVDATLAVYDGEGHAFGPRFLDSMESTGRFLDRHVHQTVRTREWCRRG